MTDNSGLPVNWAEMNHEEKRDWRLNKFVNGEGIPFVSPEAKEGFQKRAQRMADAYSIKEPDRVPILLPVGNLPYILYGINTKTTMYDSDKAADACKQFNEKYMEELEYYAAPMPFPARALEILDYKLYTWPGHGLSEDAPGYQFVEGEYMMADEYEHLITDPSDFWLRAYMPRIFGSMKALNFLQPLTNIIEMPSMQLMPLANPQVKQMLRTLLDASDELEKRARAMASQMGVGPAHGFPARMGGMAKAPFDILGDTLRGTTAIMRDLYRQSDKILEAVEVIADIQIRSLLNSPTINNVYMVTFPLHKGADGWMSKAQFETFYWPTLKRVMDALINEGLIVNLFAEGSYNTRLEYMNEFPKGTVCCWFDQTDMKLAKATIGENCCIQGNVPASMLVTGNHDEVKEYCRKLIEDCAKGGGYIMTAGCMAENPKLENLQAMMVAIREFGIYK